MVGQRPVRTASTGVGRCLWDEQTRATIDELAGEIDAAGAAEVWDAALAAPWEGPDVWVHGDVTGSNLLICRDQLCGVIDFGCSAVGDRAARSHLMDPGRSAVPITSRPLMTRSRDHGHSEVLEPKCCQKPRLRLRCHGSEEIAWRTTSAKAWLARTFAMSEAVNTSCSTHSFPALQGEIDVIGIRLGTPRDVYFAEVTTHIEGMTYGGNASTVTKIRSRLERAHDFAAERFPGDDTTSRYGALACPRAQ